MTDDLPFDYGDVARPATASPRACRTHRWVPYPFADGPAEWCDSCHRWRDDVARRRGRNNRARGNAIEREVVTSLGMKRTGQYGGPDDGRGAMFAAQVKSGGSFSERYWSWLKAVPVDAGQVAILVITDAPGPGHRRRGLVILDLDDWRDLHGEGEA